MEYCFWVWSLAEAVLLHGRLWNGYCFWVRDIIDVEMSLSMYEKTIENKSFLFFDFSVIIVLLEEG